MHAVVFGLKSLLRANTPIPTILLGAFLACAGFAVAPGLAQAQEVEEDASVQIPEGSVGGMGDINLYPKRVIIDSRQRITSIGLYNRTTFRGEYEISITDMVMTPAGGVYQIDNLPAGVTADHVKTASSMLRWSPRRVMLLGNEAQTVRIMARPPADLPDGEYRSHFMAVSVPQDVDQGFSIEDAVGGGEGGGNDIGVSIRPRFGISIPIIVRVGETTLDVGLENVALIDTEEGKAVALTITRSGTRSAYGDLLVTARGLDGNVAIARGLGVYPEVDSRTVVIGLHPDFDQTQLQPGMVLTLSFIDDDFVPGATLASRDFVVP